MSSYFLTVHRSSQCIPVYGVIGDRNICFFYKMMHNTIAFRKLFMKIMNRRGRSTEPCGTP